MMTVFVYEHLTAIGARGDEPLAPSLLAEGRAMRDAVIADFQAIPDVRVRTVADDDEGHFRQCAADADYALIVAPETDGVLEERCRWALEAGACLLGPSLDAIGLTADKLKLAEHFHRLRVPHPGTWPLGGEPRDLFPIVWKPCDGAGSLRTFLLRNAADRRQLPQASNSIAQEYFAGIPASVSFLMGPKQRAPLVPCRQHISDDGRLRYLGGSLPLPDELSARAITLGHRAVDAVAGLFGYVGVDLVLADDPRNDCVIEINPRLTTSYVGLRRAARFNIAEALLRIVRGEKSDILLWRSEPVEFRPDGSF